jgi:hypothetical protein
MSNPRLTRWIERGLAGIGVLAIIAGLCWLALFALAYSFKDFAGGSCTDTEQRIVVSPDGKRNFKSYHPDCGTTPEGQDGYFVYLSTGNPNKGYEYTPILELKKAPAGQVEVKWDSPDQLSVTFPPSTEVVEAYALVLGVRVVLPRPLK